MSKRFGKKRVPGCECDARFTCKPCLRAAAPTAVPQRGNLADRYDTYVKSATDLGWEIKSFDAWVQS